ncbi:YfiR family protein [Massilia sp. CT11-108]|uniref:YfiR family protein n=1 Tax=Massilia sp. CT11-108 TaxID=3393900 RepID=UPI0039A65C22
MAASPARGRLLAAVRSQPVLTVCDGVPAPGCVVGLVADGDRLRLRIDRLEAMAAQLRISARLLALATW